MQLTIVVNIKTGESLYRLLDALKEAGIEVNNGELGVNDMCDIITSYFNIKFSQMIEHIDSKKDEYVMSRKFICYFLQKKQGMSNKDITTLLGYKEKSNIVFYNIKYIEQMLDNKDTKFTRPYENLKRLFKRYQPGLNTIL